MLPVVQLPETDEPFPIHLPVGIPRRINPDNFFGITKKRWLEHRVTVPTGPLALFDRKYFRPYAEEVIAALARSKPHVVIALAITPKPSRYVFVRATTHRPLLRLYRAEELIPAPKQITLEEVLRELDPLAAGLRHDEDMFDLLSMIQEDVGASRWETARRDHPWIGEILR